LLREVPTCLSVNKGKVIAMTFLVRLILSALQMLKAKGDTARYSPTRGNGKVIRVCTFVLLDIFEILTFSGCLEIEEHIITVATKQGSEIPTSKCKKKRKVKLSP
jgi:hypothetical protein